MTHDELIAALENAEEGSRELGDDVLRAVGWRWEARKYEMDKVPLEREVIVRPDGNLWNWKTGPLPNPTTSIDAAISLMPERWNWLVQTEFDGITAAVWPPGNAADYPDVTANTPALALCVAIIRANKHG